MYKTHLKNFICFEFKEFIAFKISSSGNIFGIKMEIAEVLLVHVSSESFSLGYSVDDVS